MNPHVTLAVAALLWFGIHRGVAGSGLRIWLAGRLGERGFQGFFSLLSLSTLSFLVYAYRRAPCEPLWTTPHALFWLPLAIVPLAFVFLVGAFSVPNPTAVGGERALERVEPARGMVRITRHPFLWGVMLWSGVHLLVNGNIPALLLFGSLFATAAVGTLDIDRKRARAAPEQWKRFSAVTSNLPFAAIVAGRNRLVLRELLPALALGLLVAAVLVYFHGSLFGLSALRALS
jgi:uncharacterized membrane protein